MSPAEQEVEYLQDLRNLYCILFRLMAKYNIKSAKKLNKFLEIECGEKLAVGHFWEFDKYQYIDFTSKFIVFGLKNGK